MAAIPKLIILSEQLRGQTYDLTEEHYIIGRLESNNICIQDPTVSGNHCHIVRNDDGTYRAIDQGSTNGTRINGIKVTEQNLVNSDILQVGGIEIMFDCEDKSLTSVLSTQTGIDLSQTSGQMEVGDLGNFSPFQKSSKKTNQKQVKLAFVVIISLLIIIVVALASIVIVKLMN
jgi:pSer/pThr/pTyr-binding forkhead associated (FHA) protein